MDIGSLYDDLEGLNKVVEGEHEVSILDFDRLGNLLILIGSQISKSDKVFK